MHMFLLQFFFWFVFGICIYCYIGYPIILLIIRMVSKKVIAKDEIYPHVSILIAAYNEEKAIKQKIEALLAQDYPEEKFEIFIGSDGSTDNTDEIVRKFCRKVSNKITFVRNDVNQGKNTLYNKIYPMTADGILFLSDATSIWPRDLLKKLVQNFNDPHVGVVGVNLKYREPDKKGPGDYELSMVEGQQNYWEYETFIRKMESDISTLIGVSGATFALRRHLYTHVDPSLQEDFITPLNAIERGFRVVLEDSVCVYEEASCSNKDEFSMRVRVATRAFFSIWYKRKLLNPFRYPIVSWQLFSHKILRLLMPFFLIAIYLSNALIVGSYFLYLFFFIGQTIFYGMAVMGPVLERRNYKKILLPYYFLLGNRAYLYAFIRFFTKNRYIKWETIR